MGSTWVGQMLWSFVAAAIGYFGGLIHGLFAAKKQELEKVGDDKKITDETDSLSNGGRPSAD